LSHVRIVDWHRRLDAVVADLVATVSEVLLDHFLEVVPVMVRANRDTHA
jgi:hypothetical protein